MAEFRGCAINKTLLFVKKKYSDSLEASGWRRKKFGKARKFRMIEKLLKVITLCINKDYWMNTELNSSDKDKKNNFWSL